MKSVSFLMRYYNITVGDLLVYQTSVCFIRLRQEVWVSASQVVWTTHMLKMGTLVSSLLNLFLELQLNWMDVYSTL